MIFILKWPITYITVVVVTTFSPSRSDRAVRFPVNEEGPGLWLPWSSFGSAVDSSRALGRFCSSGERFNVCVSSSAASLDTSSDYPCTKYISCDQYKASLTSNSIAEWFWKLHNDGSASSTCREVMYLKYRVELERLTASKSFLNFLSFWLFQFPSWYELPPVYHGHYSIVQSLA